MQTDIEIGESSITGTLKYVTDYTGFSGDVSEQSGNYLALHVEAEDAEKITIELVGGTVGHPVIVDSDGLAVVRITDNETQKVKFVAYKGDYSVTKEYSLTELTLNAE